MNLGPTNDQDDRYYDYDGVSQRKRRWPKFLGMVIGLVAVVAIVVFIIRGRNDNLPEPVPEETVSAPETAVTQSAPTLTPTHPTELAVYTQTTSRTFFAAGSDLTSALETSVDDRQHISLSAGSSGISLHQILYTLTDFEQVDGAYYDHEKEQLIIMGSNISNLPSIDPDDAAIALRTVLLGNDDFGVTIVPTAAQLTAFASGKPVTGPMDVLYFGQTEFSHFGKVMYQADRYLKNLTIGLAENGETIDGGLVDFETQLTQLATNINSDPSWYRLWFTPSPVTVAVSGDKQGMWIDQESLSILVEGECVAFDENGEMQSDTQREGCQAVDDFANLLETNYELLASNEIALHQLKQLLQLITVARWIRDYNIPLDASSLLAYPLLFVDTPGSTPAHSRLLPLDDGVTVNLFGGVDFSRQPNYQQVTDDTHVVNQIKEQALSAQAGTAVPVNINGNPAWLAATPLQTTDSVGSFSLRQSVAAVDGARVLPLQFDLFYDSLTQAVSFFGPGWQFTPAQLTLGSPILASSTDPPYATVVITNRRNGRRRLFRLRRGPGGLVEYAVADDLVEYDTLESEETLHFDISTREFIWHDGETTIRFDEDGRYLREEQDHESITAHWDSNNLIQLTHSNGGRIDLAYMENAIAVQTSDGQEVTLQYDGSVSTITLAGETRPNATFMYEARRVSQITNDNGFEQIQTYDDRGVMLSSQLQRPDGSQRIYKIQQPIFDTFGQVTVAERILLSDAEVDALGVVQERLLNLDVHELTLTDEPLTAVLWENGAVKAPIEHVRDVEPILAERLEEDRNSCSVCPIVTESIFHIGSVNYDPDSGTLVIKKSGEEIGRYTIKGLTVDDVARINDVATSVAAGHQAGWAKSFEDSIVFLIPGQPELARIENESLNIVKESNAIHGTSQERQMRKEALLEILDPITNQIALSLQLRTIEPVQERFYLVGSPTLVRAFNAAYPRKIIAVSATRTVEQARQIVETLDQIRLESVVIQVAADLSANDPATQSLIEQLREDHPSVQIIEVSGESGRDAIVSQLAKENVLVLNIAHNAKGQLQLDASTVLRREDIQQVLGDTILLNCKSACFPIAHQMIEKGGRLTIAATRDIGTDEATEWIRSFVSSVANTSNGLTILDAVEQTEADLLQRMGDRLLGYIMMFLVFDEDTSVAGA